jgi:hypothetical protein
VLGGFVDGEDAVGLKLIEEAAAIAEVEVDGAEIEGVLEFLDGPGEVFVEDAFAEAGDEDEVAAFHEPEGGDDTGGIFAAEVGEDDDEGAGALANHEMFGGFGEIAGVGGGLVIVEVVEDGGDGVLAFDGGEPARGRGKRGPERCSRGTGVSVF